MIYELTKLTYAYDSLEPFIDAQTMEIHHSKHHATYVKNLNTALEKNPELAEIPLAEMLKDISVLPDGARSAIKNNGGGHYNHDFFWSILGKNNGKKPTGELLKAIEKKFGEFEIFKAEFTKTALMHFGSGWAWLVLKNGELEITNTPNQEVVIGLGMTPLMCVDVWEHAYYLKYQNRRAEYVENFWNVINWKKVEELYLANK